MHKIGDKIIGEHPSIFELDIKSLVSFINPSSYNLNIEGIDPEQYYITSGDAIQKAMALERDIKDHLKNIKSMTQTKKLAKYEQQVRKALTQTKKLIKYLILARGDKKFLETEWDNHVLYLTPKNPRAI
jgi:hypothetical protein